ncbi:phytanoyl-CoA dioxygenase [Tanacetum coccineum]
MSSLGRCCWAAVVRLPSLGRHHCFWAAVVRPSSLGHRAVSHTTDLEEDPRWWGFVVRYTWVEEVGKDDIHSNQSTMGLVGTLTSDQLHYFNSQGYLVIESFSSNEEVDALRKRMDELLHGFNPSSSPGDESQHSKKTRRSKNDYPTSQPATNITNQKTAGKEDEDSLPIHPTMGLRRKPFNLRSQQLHIIYNSQGYLVIESFSRNEEVDA